MDAKNRNKHILRSINAMFIDQVGPIGDALINDAVREWKAKQWRGQTAFRNYIKTLASNLDNSNQQKFITEAGQLLLEAERTV
ncbi:hypothetical protein P886_1846 [Alteromonadaceae bacterium 2753L.S.0a.02]|nr:hypothetical protein P886_1846 [Alteromonadaceae bacterium 2753L.S.0a.02]